MTSADLPPNEELAEVATDLKGPFSTAFLVMWGLVVLTVVGTLAGAHLLTLPTPSRIDPRLAQLVRATDPGPRWSMLHILRAECGCSRRIAGYLVSRRALAGVAERVVLVGTDEALRKTLASAGFSVETISEDDLLRTYGVEAVPLLTVAAAGGEVRYVGGYTARKQGPVPADRKILHRLQDGESVEPLPLFGCPTSERLKRATDPLGIR